MYERHVNEIESDYNLHLHHIVTYLNTSGDT